MNNRRSLLDMEHTLFGFSAPEIEQQEKRAVIAPDIECWNLKKMGFLEFVREFQSVEPPLNHNVTDDNYLYGIMGKSKDTHPAMPGIYKQCSWGLLLPMQSDGHRLYLHHEQALFVLNLYSPKFLYPLFVASHGGLEDLRYALPKFWHVMDHTQAQSALFKRSEFPIFYRKMMPLGRFFYSDTEDIDRWNTEHSRVGMACNLFRELRRYETKQPITFHREYFDICVILETLLMSTKDRFGSTHVPRRMEILLKQKFPDVRQCIREAYDERDPYAHGQTFKEQKRYSMNNMYSSSTSAYSKKHFELTEKATTYLRHLLVAYLHILRSKQSPGLSSRANQKLIAEACGSCYLQRVPASKKRKPNRRLARKLRHLSKEILSLMP